MQAVPSSSSPRRSNPIDSLWRLLTADRTLALITALLIVTGLAGLVLPQLPTEAIQQGIANRWLVETGSRYGILGTLLQAGGLFDLRHSPWLRGLMGFLAFVLLLRLAQAGSEANSRLRPLHPSRMAAPARGWPLQAHLGFAATMQTAAAELADDLRSEGWRVTSGSSDTGVHMLAERSAAGVVAIPLIYLGLVLVLAALWINQVFGWQEVGLALVPGETVHLSQQELAITLVTLENGTPAVAAQRTTGPLITRAFSSGGKVNAAGITVQRTGTGQAVSVSAQDAQGNRLPLQPLEEQSSLQSSLSLVFDQPRAERVFLVPDRQLVFSVVAFPALPERGFSGPTFLVQAFHAGQREPVINRFVEGGGALTIDGDRYELASGQYFTVRVSRSPGTPLGGAGSFLVLIGVLLSIWRPAGRLYLHLSEERGHLHVAASLQAALTWRQSGRWFVAWAATYGAKQEAQL